MAELRNRVVAVVFALALGGALLTCCGMMNGTQRERSLAGRPVHTELEILRKRFPELGRMVDAHWQELAVGADSWWIPGPSDVMFQAIIVLERGDLERLTTEHNWEPPRVGWDKRMTGELRPFAPTSADWRHSALLEAAVRAPIYTGGGDVIVDLRSGTVYLNLLAA